MTYNSPELEAYMVLGQELFRRIYADDSAEEIHSWLALQMQKLGGGDPEARMLWAESFDLYEQIMQKRTEQAALPASERRILTWPWPSWSNLLDPLDPGILAVLSAADGGGKCLGRGTRVVMFDGTLRAVEDLSIGDLLMGPDSKPRTIKQLGSGHDQMYWVIQNSGVDYRANGAHILALIETDRAGNRTYIEKTIDEINAMPPWYTRRCIHGYKTAVDFPTQDVPLAPYLLGYWLGDGSSHGGTIFTVDREVIAYLQQYAESIGTECHIQDDKPGKACQKVVISNGRGGGSRRRGREPGWILGQMGLLSDWGPNKEMGSRKRIPHEYIANSERVRLELLAGLIDSDGHLHHGGYTITQKNNALAHQIKYLADSLGFRTHIASKKATIKRIGFTSTVWRVSIYGDVERIPVLVERKKAGPRRINKDWRVTGIRIEPDNVDAYFGFVIDGDGLFLLEDMTVTHNTLYAENLAEHWARCGMNVVFIHFELNRALMLDRRMSRQSGILRRDLKAGTLTAQQNAECERANERLRSWPGSITYVHTPGWTMERAMGEVNALTAEGICDVFIVDYLEKAAPSNRQLKTYGNNVFAREADYVEVVKRTAEVIARPALLLAQLNKLGKQQAFDTLDRTAIRGAGEKTEKANIVILLHRENSESQIVRGRIDKNTMGRCGTFTQFMEGARFLVTDIQPDEPPSGNKSQEALQWESKY